MSTRIPTSHQHLPPSGTLSGSILPAIIPSLYTCLHNQQLIPTFSSSPLCISPSSLFPCTCHRHPLPTTAIITFSSSSPLCLPQHLHHQRSLVLSSHTILWLLESPESCAKCMLQALTHGVNLRPYLATWSSQTKTCLIMHPWLSPLLLLPQCIEPPTKNLKISLCSSLPRRLYSFHCVPYCSLLQFLLRSVPIPFA